MPVDDQNAESSTAAVEAALGTALAEKNVAEYMALANASDIAAQTGKPIPEVPAASSKPASSDQKPAAEPGNEKPIQEKKPKTGEDRANELKAEIAELLRKRAELQGKVPTTETPGDKKADPPPANVDATKPKEAAKTAEPVEPKLEDFKTFAEFQAADRKYIRELIASEATKTVAAQEEAKATGAKNKVLEDRWKQRVEAAKEDHADFAEVAFSAATPITPAMDGFILDSEIGPKILYRLGENGSAEGKRIAALPPYAAVRALIAIEHELGAASGAQAEKKTPVKRITTAAPAPATDLGGKGTEPGDPAMAALARKDVAEYNRIMNLRDLKARTG